MPVHPTGLFEYESIDWGWIDMSFIVYRNCVVLMEVGRLKAGTCLKRVIFRVDRFYLEFMDNDAEDFVTVLEGREVRSFA